MRLQVNIDGYNQFVDLFPTDGNKLQKLVKIELVDGSEIYDTLYLQPGL